MTFISPPKLAFLVHALHASLGTLEQAEKDARSSPDKSKT